MPETLLPTCGVCGSREWKDAYAGGIRDGVFGRERQGRVVQCAGCTVQYLAEPSGLDDQSYRDGTYRVTVGEDPGPQSYFELHDVEQFQVLPLLPSTPLRGRRVADVGCGGGSLLDAVSGLAEETIAIEPSRSYHNSLRQRGHVVYDDVAAAAADREGAVDLVVCLSVIEHVEQPDQLLAAIRRLLAPGGVAVISTPNRDDFLLHVGSEAYRRFFYRVVHRYYFNATSLGRAATTAGFGTCEIRYHQRFGFGNFVGWLLQQRPTGRDGAPPLGGPFDRTWRATLEEAGRSDYLYAYLR